MAQKRIQDISGSVVTPNALSILAVDDATGGNTNKWTVEDMADFALSGSTIGGNTSGDILTTDDSQTITNKRLTSPAINSATAITATSAELNTLDGITATTAELNIMDGVTSTTAELNFSDGVTSNIQTQLDLKADASSISQYNYRENWTSAVTGTYLITASTIETALGFAHGEYIDWRIGVVIGEDTTGTYFETKPVAKVYTTVVGTTTVLDEIGVPVTNGDKYYINVVCTKVIA